jgi:hypothetical protein
MADQACDANLLPRLRNASFKGFEIVSGSLLVEDKKLSTDHAYDSKIQVRIMNRILIVNLHCAFDNDSSHILYDSSDSRFFLNILTSRLT